MTFFVPGYHQQVFDGQIVRFNNPIADPAPPQPLVYEHFKQAVLANMKGAGKVPFLDYDPSEDSQSLSAFEGPEGKVVLEAVLANKLGGLGMDDNDNASEHGTLVD